MADDQTKNRKLVEHVELRLQRGETVEQAEARVFLESDLNTATTLQWARPKHLPAQVTPLMDELARQSAEVKAGVQRGEAMMANHASVLDALFNTLTRRAMANADAGNIDALDTYLRLAFKAQSQCRNTWESIAEIRKPRSVAFVKQANIAAGHQQVNNVRAREKQKAPNELNEVAHERTVDRGGKAPAIGADTSVATLGALDGAANARGQGKVRMQQLSGRGAIPAPRTGKTAKG